MHTPKTSAHEDAHTTANHSDDNVDALPAGCKQLASRIAALENNTTLEDRLTNLEDQLDIVEDSTIGLSTKVEGLTQRMNRSEELHNDHKHVLEEIHDVLTEMKELLKTWNSVKSTVSMTKNVGDALMWLSKAGAAVAVIWAAFKFSVTH